MSYERKREMEQATFVQPPERYKIVPRCSGCGKPWDDCKGVCARLNDPGNGTIVVLEFDSEEKANEFREAIKRWDESSYGIFRWDRFLKGAIVLPGLADDSD